MIWHGLRKQSHAVAVSVHPPTTALQIAPTRPSNGETPGIAASTDSPVLAVSHPASRIFSWISRILAWENSRRSWDLMSTFEAKAKLGGPRIQAINACRARRGRRRPKTKACERRRVPYRVSDSSCRHEWLGRFWNSMAERRDWRRTQGRPRHPRIFRMDSGEWITASKRIRP